MGPKLLIDCDRDLTVIVCREWSYESLFTKFEQDLLKSSKVMSTESCCLITNTTGSRKLQDFKMAAIRPSINGFTRNFEFTGFSLPSIGTPIFNKIKDPRFFTFIASYGMGRI